MLEYIDIGADRNNHVLTQEWGGLKPVLAGGGIHAHPAGTRAGAQAVRQAIDAVMAGEDLDGYAVKHKELKTAIKKWGQKER